MPLITVIVPNYNHAKYLSERIESILNQTYQDFELILLDDCSSDNSLEILKIYENHPKVSHLIVNEINSGSPFKQWEKGINLAKGDFIWIAESDDINSEKFLETVVLYYNTNKSCGMIYVKTNYIDNNNSILPLDKYQLNLSTIFKSTSWYLGGKYIEDYLIKLNTILNASSIIYKKELFYKCDGFDQTFNYGGDWYLYLKMLNFTNIFYIDETLNYRRIHDKSHTFCVQDKWIDEHIQVRKAYKSFLKLKNIKNEEISSQNQYLLKELYALKSISFAKEKKIIKMFLFLIKSSHRNFLVYLKHDLYWLIKSKNA